MVVGEATMEVMLDQPVWCRRVQHVLVRGNRQRSWSRNKCFQSRSVVAAKFRNEHLDLK